MFRATKCEKHKGLRRAIGDSKKGETRLPESGSDFPKG